jgi:hypothetical protein
MWNVEKISLVALLVVGIVPPVWAQPKAIPAPKKVVKDELKVDAEDLEESVAGFVAAIAGQLEGGTGVLLSDKGLVAFLRLGVTLFKRDPIYGQDLGPALNALNRKNAKAFKKALDSLSATDRAAVEALVKEAETLAKEGNA